MKKILLFLTMVGGIFTYSQVIYSQDFEGLTLGNVGTDFTGNTAGQGGLYLYQGTAPDYQIATIDAAHGKSYQITTGNSYASTSNTSSRLSWVNTTANTGTAGNNILKGTIQFFTGPATGQGKISAQVYDYTTSTNGNGVVGASYDFGTKKLGAFIYLTAVATGAKGFYTISLGTATYPANTWVSMSYYYDKTTGNYTFVTPEGTYTWTNSTNSGYTVNPNLYADTMYYISYTNTGNNVTNVSAVDNSKLEYISSIMSTSESKNLELGISIYPNPAVDYLNIDSDSRIISANIFDLAGRKMAVTLEKNNTINVSALRSGTYILYLETKDGKYSEKFIKK